MRVVVDPNVLVSAAVASGVSAELLDRWLTDRSFDVVVCPALIGELRDVLARDRFRRWISIHESDRFVGRLESEGERWTAWALVMPRHVDDSNWMSSGSPWGGGQRVPTARRSVDRVLLRVGVDQRAM